jgi:asparagine synthase (glutamine-hydrolysing)
MAIYEMFYLGELLKDVLIDLRNILTLRYDPTHPQSSGMKSITSQEIKSRSMPYPSWSDIERILRRVIANKINSLNPDSISVALSAGVDSNLVLSLIRDEFPDIDINCITISFDEFTEAKGAQKLAESNSSTFHNVFVDNPLQKLPYLISIIGEPRWNLYQYYFMEKSRRYSNLLFTGDGGDELFAGYTFRYRKFLNSFSNNLNWYDRARLYIDCHDRDWVPDQENMFGRSMNFNWEQIYSLFRDYFENDLDPLDQIFMADYHGKLLHDFIPSNEKFLKHFNMIGIAPILDASVIEMAFKIPPSLKYDPIKNIGKIQLREIVSRFRSDKVLDTKIGFGMDLKELWKRVAKGIVISNLDNGRIFEDELINQEFYQRSMKRIEETLDVRYISKVMQLLSLEIWYKLFVTMEMSPKRRL